MSNEHSPIYIDESQLNVPLLAVESSLLAKSNTICLIWVQNMTNILRMPYTLYLIKLNNTNVTTIIIGIFFQSNLMRISGYNNGHASENHRSTTRNIRWRLTNTSPASPPSSSTLPPGILVNDSWWRMGMVGHFLYVSCLLLHTGI